MLTKPVLSEKRKTGKPFLLNSSKSLIKNPGDHKTEVKLFIKKQHIMFKKEEDLIKLAEYYSQL